MAAVATPAAADDSSPRFCVVTFGTEHNPLCEKCEALPEASCKSGSPSTVDEMPAPSPALLTSVAEWFGLAAVGLWNNKIHNVDLDLDSLSDSDDEEDSAAPASERWTFESKIVQASRDSEIARRCMHTSSEYCDADANCVFKGSTCLPKTQSQWWSEGTSFINSWPSGTVFVLRKHFDDPDGTRPISCMSRAGGDTLVCVFPTDPNFRPMPKQLCTEIVAYLKAVHRNYQRMVLGGHSMGCAWAQERPDWRSQGTDDDDCCQNVHVVGSGPHMWATADDARAFEMYFEHRFLFFGLQMVMGGTEPQMDPHLLRATAAPGVRGLPTLMIMGGTDSTPWTDGSRVFDRPCHEVLLVQDTGRCVLEDGLLENEFTVHTPCRNCDADVPRPKITLGKSTFCPHSLCHVMDLYRDVIWSWLERHGGAKP